MEPIINPWLIYLIGFVPKLTAASVIVFILSVVVFFLCIIIGAECNKNEETLVEIYDYAKKLMVISGFTYLLLPDQNTLIAMIASSYITPDNIAITEDHVIELINKIMEAVNNK